MEGYLENIEIVGNKKPKKWKSRFLKIDDIGAKLLTYKDNTQTDLKSQFQLTGCELRTPMLGDVNHGISIDTKAHCFVVYESSIYESKKVLYLSAVNDETKKKWVHAIHQMAKLGPRDAHFADELISDEGYLFEARVSEFRVVQPKGYAEYKVRCNCRVLSRHAAKKITRKWDVWHRFSEFAALDNALQQDLGFQMNEVHFPPRKREAFRGLFGKKLDTDFLEHRREGLDVYISKLCRVRTAVEFFKHHSSVRFKAFVEFEAQAHHLDDSEYHNETNNTTKSRKHRKEHRTDRSKSGEKHSKSSSPHRHHKHYTAPKESLFGEASALNSTASMVSSKPTPHAAEDKKQSTKMKSRTMEKTPKDKNARHPSINAVARAKPLGNPVKHESSNLAPPAHFSPPPCPVSTQNSSSKTQSIAPKPVDFLAEIRRGKALKKVSNQHASPKAQTKTATPGGNMSLVSALDQALKLRSATPTTTSYDNDDEWQ